ncbi:hypothetical protein Bca52824_029638 [Brassica carinata]|uniref:DUF676 domain-containing protein n=1 Tax=Brassica carinata TaxID=52824 RepID=A0A8X7VEB7_BRACI|nr:hypothetical protein Bca52824_029638 [Brassica carinata]
MCMYTGKAEEVWGGGVSDDEREFGGLEVFGGAVREEVPRESVRAPGSESTSSTFTFDGVDIMGERLANEVFSVVKNRGAWLKKISFVAHLLGGLVARYDVGKLYEQQLVIKVV